MIACGGGSDGGGNGNDVPGSGEPVDDNISDLGPDPAPVVYSGESSAVALASDNIAALIFNVFSEFPEESESDDSGGNIIAATNTPKRSIASAVTGSKSRKAKTETLSAETADSPSASSNPPLIAREIEEVETCYRGTISYRGDLDSDNIGYLIADHDNCVNDGVRTDGRTRLDSYEYSDRYESVMDGRFDYKRLTTVYGVWDQTSRGDASTTISGVVDFRIVDEENAVEENISNIVIQNDYANGMIQLENFVETVQYDSLSNRALVSYSMAGRRYDSDYGYIDVETISPILTDPDDPSAAAYAGKFRITGASGAQATITLQGEHIIYVELDANGDGIYEQSAYFNSTRLLDWVNGDITDSDGDGIPDRWEEQYGLDPQVDDSSEDFDGDQASNFDEYIHDTAPDNARVLPPVADLQLSLGGNNDPYFPAGDETDFQFWVRNDGPDTAANVSVQLDFSGHFQLNQSNCIIEEQSVYCSYDRIPSGESHAITVNNAALPSTPATYTVNGTANAKVSVDTVTENNSLTYDVLVEPNVADLSVAFEGSSDEVSAANYFEYVVNVANNGVVDAENFVTTHALPAGVSLASSGVDDMCSESGRVVTCTYRILSAKTSRSFTYRAVAPDSIGTITSSVVVSSDAVEQNLSNNEATHSVQVVTPVSDLAMVIEDSKQSFAIDTTDTLYFSILSARPDYVSPVQLSIDLPPSVDLVNEENNKITCTDTKPSTCAITLSRRSPGSGKLGVGLTSGVPGIHEVSLTVTSDAVDPDLSNNTSSFQLFFGTPVDSIQQKIDAAEDGDTVTVPPGYYYGNLEYRDKNIDLVSEGGPDTTFMSKEASYAGVAPGPEGRISGFTFTHTEGTPIVVYDSNVRISNNVFEYLEGSLASAIVVGLYSNPIIENNIIRNVTCRSGRIYAVKVRGDSSPIIKNNLFSNNTNCVAILFDPLNLVMTPSVVNNTFSGNDVALRVPEAARGGGASFVNNIIYNNSVGLDTITDCGADCNTFQSNLVFNNDSDYYNTQNQTGVNGNIAVDPLFVDYENSDFSLSEASPAIDAGQAAAAPADDLLGNARPVDGDGSGTAEPDIGAYEYQ